MRHALIKNGVLTIEVDMAQPVRELWEGSWETR